MRSTRALNALTFVPAVLVALALLAGAAPAHAWSAWGHGVVGAVADDALTPEARAEVRRLLDGRPLAAVGAWADRVRRDRPGTGPLHYMNGPVDRVVPRRADFEIAQGNVYTAILGYAERLADTSLPRETRAEALKFLVHFIGDLHQPLHCGFLEDRGGNTVAVIVDGERSNLHRYWDHDVLAPAIAEYRPVAFARALDARIRPAERHAWRTSLDPVDWILEARAYLFIGLYPASDNRVPELDAQYRATWQPVAERQLARAGLRLAATLNALIADGASPFDAPPVALPEP